MKCEKCGANLDLETPFCPYCGAKNKSGIKHREDMRRYDRDYRATKEEVIRNSRRFNIRNFKVTMVAITIAAVLGTIFICVFNENLARNVYYERCGKKTEAYVEEIKQLLRDGEHIELHDLIQTENLKTYRVKELSDYTTACTAATTYARLFSEAVTVLTPGENSGSYLVSSMASDANFLLKYINQGSNNPEVQDYYEKLLADIKLLFIHILGAPEESVAELETLSQANVNLIIEEAYNARKEK